MDQSCLGRRGLGGAQPASQPHRELPALAPGGRRLRNCPGRGSVSSFFSLVTTRAFAARNCRCTVCFPAQVHFHNLTSLDLTEFIHGTNLPQMHVTTAAHPQMNPALVSPGNMTSIALKTWPASAPGAPAVFPMGGSTAEAGHVLTCLPATAVHPPQDTRPNTHVVAIEFHNRTFHLNAKLAHMPSDFFGCLAA